MKRRYPSKREKADILFRQGGKCAMCEKEARAYEYDHELDLWTHGRNETENFRALCIPCHKFKTAQDAKTRAKIKRIQKKHGGEHKPKSRIRTRGFDRMWRRKLNGKTERREGAPKMG